MIFIEIGGQIRLEGFSLSSGLMNRKESGNTIMTIETAASCLNPCEWIQNAVQAKRCGHLTARGLQLFLLLCPAMQNSMVD